MYNKVWLKKTVVILLAIAIVLIGFAICWNQYHTKPHGWDNNGDKNIFVCYNDGAYSWEGELRNFFRNNGMWFWIIGASVAAISVIGGGFILFNNKLFLFGGTLCVVGMLTNYINWVVDSRGALDYWCFKESQILGAFLGLAKLAQGWPTDNYCSLNWPDLVTWIGTDILIVSLIIILIQQIYKHVLKRKRMKKHNLNNIIIV